VTAACGDADRAGAKGESTTLHGTVDLSIGEVDGADEYTFARIGGITVDSGGRIFAVDNGAHTVRVFGPDGRFRFSIGRRGQGPGELNEPCCVALRGDTLWVRDNGNNRYVLYTVGDTAAVYGASVRMAHTDVNRWAPVTFDSAGNVIDIGSMPDTASRAPIETRFHIDRAGQVVARRPIPRAPIDSVPIYTVSRKVPDGFVTRYVYAPYPPLAMRAHAPNGEQARAVSSRYSIAWLAADGTPLRTITGAATPPSLSASETARAESSIVNDMRGVGKTRAESPFSVPTHKQPLRRLYFDLDGRLWVERSVAEGASRTADVYDRDGRLAFSAEWPANVDLASFGAIRAMTGYGVLTDSLDVERVARVRLR
jgi:hypothetical protein